MDKPDKKKVVVGVVVAAATVLVGLAAPAAARIALNHNETVLRID